MDHNGTKKQRLENEINNRINFNAAVSITFSGDFSFYMVLVPQVMILSPASGDVHLDNDMLEDLQQGRVLNWCRTADRLYPIYTKSDGNCLCHATSMAIWGIPDEKNTLRNLILVSIDSTEKKERWRRHYETQGPNGRDSMQLSHNDWEREWKHVVNTASTTTPISSATPFAHLEAIHIFTLANILRRPIIIVADLTARTLSGTSLQESDIGGIYLPLDRPASDCYKYPIILGYNMSHFCPLLPQETPEKSTFKIPIVTRDGSSLPIRFLNAEEEKRASTLMKSYLKVTEVPLSSTDTLNLVLCTEIKSLLIHESLRVFPETQMNVSVVQQPAASPGVAAANFESVPCITPGCTFYGSPATGRMCSGCLEKYLKRQTNPRPQPPQIPDIRSQPIQLNNTEPTAPPLSMPLSEPFVDLSIMGEPCKTGCGFRCSVKTFPYCHECAERMRNISATKHTPTAHNTSKVELPPAGFSEGAIFGLGGAIGGQASGTGQTEIAVSGTRFNQFEPGFGGSEQTRIQNGSGYIGSRENPSHMIQTAALFGGGTNKDVEIMNPGTQICKGDECTSFGKSHLGGLCNRCYMKEERKKKICSTPGCLGDRGESDLCHECHQRTVTQTSPLKLRRQEKEALPDKQLESGGLGGHLSSSSLIASGAECNIEVLNPKVVEGSEDKIKCVSPMCNNLIYPPNKLCSSCIEVLRRNQVSAQEKRAHPIEPTVVSLSDDITSTWPPGRTNSTPIAKRSHDMMNVQLSETSRSSSAPIGRKCVTPNCTKFGDPSMADMCTACYQMSHGGVTLASTSSMEARRHDDGFSAMMERVASQKRSPRHCKAANCSNYGNPNNEGFCNSCYPKYLNMMQNQM